MLVKCTLKKVKTKDGIIKSTRGVIKFVGITIVRASFFYCNSFYAPAFEKTKAIDVVDNEFIGDFLINLVLECRIDSCNYVKLFLRHFIN